MPKFRKKPVVIEAVQVRWSQWGELCELLGGIISEDNPGRYAIDYSDDCGEGWNGPDERPGPFIEVTIPTLEGDMIARHGDWVIKGVEGELYPCKPRIFDATYEAVE